jgi:hypothetical protein
MAKTNFSDGDELTPTFMNGIYGTGGTGGHRHDGVDLDNHAAKISLPSEVDGVLYQSQLPSAASFVDGVQTDSTSVSGGSYLKWQTYTHVFTGTTTYPVNITLDVEAILPWANIRGVFTTHAIAIGTPYGYGATGIIHYATGYGGFPVTGYTLVQGTGAVAHLFVLTAFTSPAPLAGDRMSIVILHV